MLLRRAARSELALALAGVAVGVVHRHILAIREDRLPGQLLEHHSLRLAAARAPTDRAFLLSSEQVRAPSVLLVNALPSAARHTVLGRCLSPALHGADVGCELLAFEAIRHAGHPCSSLHGNLCIILRQDAAAIESCCVVAITAAGEQVRSVLLS